MTINKSKSKFPDKKSKTSFGVPTREDTPDWQATIGTYIAGQAEIDELDILAIELELKWGVDRLRLLVPAEMREKFDRQRYLTNQAIWHGDLQDVIREAKRMMSAWRALDRIAEAANCSGLSPDVWEVSLPDGSVAALVRSTADAHHVVSEGRHLAVYTLDEIANLLAGFPALATAKTKFPGAQVTRVGTSVSDPLRKVPYTSGKIDDAMPF